MSASQYSTSAFAQNVLDNKGSVRIDWNSRLGQISGYYFIDDYNLDNPYPGTVAGASIPGFDGLFIGRAQLLSLSDNKLIGSNTVNEFHFGYLRNANIIGQPKGGLGVSLASQGFVTGAGTSGIYVQAPQFEGVENITFPTFVMGVPITNGTQVNNTFYLSEGLSRAIGAHTLKFSAQCQPTRVNEAPTPSWTSISMTSPGPGADSGLASSRHFDPAAQYRPGATAGWRRAALARSCLRRPPDALMICFLGRVHGAGLVVLQAEVDHPDRTAFPDRQCRRSGLEDASPTRYGEFSRGCRRTCPDAGHGSKTIFSGGQGSIRASYGIFYTEFPGLLAGIMYSVPPFGYNYLSPGPPLMATPFITAASGVNNGQRFPFPFSPHTVSASHPDTSVNWANPAPLSADPFFYYRNRALHRQLQLHVLDPAPITLHIADGQLRGQPGSPRACRGFRTSAIPLSASASPAAARSAKTLPIPTQPDKMSMEPALDSSIGRRFWDRSKLR